MAKAKKFSYATPSKSEVDGFKDGGKSFDSFLKVKPMKVAEGDHSIRILPNTWHVDPKYAPYGSMWGLKIVVHNDVGTDRSSYLCLRKTGDRNKPCPVCELISKLQSRGNEEAAQKIRGNERVVSYVIDRKSKSEEPQVLVMSQTLKNEIVSRQTDRKTGELIQIDNIEEGYDVWFTRTGQKLRTKYINVNIERDPSPLFDDDRDTEQALSFITDNPLPTVLKFYTYEHIKKVLEGADVEEDAEEEAPTRTSRGRSKAPVEDEGEELGQDADSDDDVKPVRGRPKPRAEEPDEEEVEEDRPARGRPRGRPAGKAQTSRLPASEEDEGDDVKPVRGRPKPRAEEPDEEEVEEDRPARGRPRGRPAGRTAVREVDEDEGSEQSENDDGTPWDEDEEQSVSKPARGRPRSRVEEPDEEEVEEYEDKPVRPRRR